MDGGHAFAVGIKGQLSDAREAFFQFVFEQANFGCGNHQGAFGGVSQRRKILVFFDGSRKASLHSAPPGKSRIAAASLL